MDINVEVAKFNFQKQITYPLEILTAVLRKIVSLGFLILFWYVISRDSSDLFDLRQLISYFLIAGGIKSLTSNDSRFGRMIQYMIYRGELSNYFIKPVKIIPFLYSSYFGSWTVSNIYSLISILVGTIILPPNSILNYLFFLLFFIIALLSNIFINVMIASIAFYIPEANEIKNTYNHIFAVFSGALIPLVYFPDTLERIISLTPFPYLLYAPINALQSKTINGSILISLGISAIWLIILYFSSRYVWKKSVKSYDGVGI